MRAGSAFGAGMGYAEWAFDNASFSVSGQVSDTTNATVSVQLSATSTRYAVNGRTAGVGTTTACKTVVQLYVEFPQSANEPPKVLRGFQTASASSGGPAARVSFVLSARDLSVWSTEAGSWQRPRGEFGVHVGLSSRDIRLGGKVLSQ